MSFLCSRHLSLRLFKFNFKIQHRTKTTNVVGHPQFCVNVVRRGDHDNYLSCLLLPKSCRAAAFAIRAFNVAVSQVQDQVSEKQIGLMRLQFWKDTIELIFQDNPPETPIAQELARAHRKHKLSKRWFLRMIEAREELLQKNMFRTISEIEDYSEKAFSSSLYLLLESLDIRDVNADHAASHAGQVLGITTLIRAVPYNAQRRQTHLPMDVLIRHNVSQEEIYRASREQKVKDVVYDVASAAHQQLELARNLRSSTPENTHLAMLCMAACHMYLESLRIVDFDVFSPKIQSRNPWLAIAMWFQRYKKMY